MVFMAPKVPTEPAVSIGLGRLLLPRLELPKWGFPKFRSPKIDFKEKGSDCEDTPTRGTPQFIETDILDSKPAVYQAQTSLKGGPSPFQRTPKVKKQLHERRLTKST